MVYLIIAAVVIVFLIVLYNSLVVKHADVKNALSCIDVQLKKRCDLVPNLVASVQAYMTHERQTLENLADMRSRAASAGSLAERAAIDREISGGIRQIMVQAEAYPQLKASDNMLNLQRSLNEIEEQLSAARRAYNAAVTVFNTAIRIFPNNLFSSMLGYKEFPLFEVSEAERRNPSVKDLFGS